MLYMRYLFIEKPNLLFIFSDQHRATDLGCYGNDEVISPNFDHFAKEGLRFTNCYSNSPVCVPARGTLLTGLYPWHHGALTNDLPIRTALESVATTAEKNSYTSGYIGKWHLGGVPRDRFIPMESRLGFSKWYAANCTHDYSNSYFDDESNQRHFFKRHESIEQTDLALKFLEERKDKGPWTLHLSWGPPHDPYLDVPGEFLDLYKNLVPRLRPNVGEKILHTKTSFWDRKKLIQYTRGYYALISLLDHEFGRILAALDRLGLRDNTIVVYTSDHGDMLGSQGFTHKQFPFREASNVPLLVSWKDNTWTGVNEECLGLADLPVSLLVLMGLNFETKRDGENLSALFTDIKARGKEAVPLFDLVPAHQAEDRGGFEWAGLKTRTHTFAKKSDGSPWLLFDDTHDPYQLKNLVNDPSHSEMLQKLSKQTDSLLNQHDFTFGPWENTIRKLGLVDAWNKSQVWFRRKALIP